MCPKVTDEHQANDEKKAPDIDSELLHHYIIVIDLGIRKTQKKINTCVKDIPRNMHSNNTVS